MGPLIEIKGVTHAYDRVPVLSSVSLSVAAHERVFIIGANGAGKSTVARIVAGLVRPVAGSVHYDDRDITGMAPYAVARLGISYVPAYRSVFPYLSVEDNLELGADMFLAGLSRSQARASLAERKDRVLNIFPALAAKRKSDALRLSGGMQRMVEVGRAVMANPRVLILDEPTLGLDGGAVRQMAEGLSHLGKSGTTLIVIEQNVPFVTSICDRGYLMNGGQVVLAGSGKAVLDSDEVRKTYLGIV
ncbi:MAG: ATP-binding cassette domain-containing protein [Alphaproteobacteria bacterium]